MITYPNHPLQGMTTHPGDAYTMAVRGQIPLPWPGTHLTNQNLDKEAQSMADGRRFDKQEVYQIRVRGHLDDSWSEWFEGLNVTHEKDGITVLTGPVTDQPSLHGLLAKIRDLGLPLVSVNCIKPHEGEVPWKLARRDDNESEEGKSDE
jgi:hypothetical protein